MSSTCWNSNLAWEKGSILTCLNIINIYIQIGCYIECFKKEIDVRRRKKKKEMKYRELKKKANTAHVYLSCFVSHRKHE